MKKTFKTLLILAIVFLMASCLKENHSVRLKNDYYTQINNIRIGNADLGAVPPGQVSGYQSINTGNFTISGNTNNGQELSGSGSISGKGKHKWTVTVTSTGGVEFKEDK